MARLVGLAVLAASVEAFSPCSLGPTTRGTGGGIGHSCSSFSPSLSAPTLRVGTGVNGMFDWLKDAFANTEYAAEPEGVKANARHILVKNLEECNEIKAQIESGDTSFEDAARQFSTCPSRSEGGSLGNFKPGQMVPEFDKVVFSKDSVVKEVLGPVQTQFGFHLIKIESRTIPSEFVAGSLKKEE